MPVRLSTWSWTILTVSAVRAVKLQICGCVSATPSNLHDPRVPGEDRMVEMAISPEKVQRTRQVFLWLMSCVYMWAFASLYTQIPGEM